MFHMRLRVGEVCGLHRYPCYSPLFPKASSRKFGFPENLGLVLNISDPHQIQIVSDLISGLMMVGSGLGQRPVHEIRCEGRKMGRETALRGMRVCVKWNGACGRRGYGGNGMMG